MRTKNQNQTDDFRNQYRNVDNETGASWTGNNYEITFISAADNKVRKAVVEACSKSEAEEIFASFPAVRNNGVEILEIKGVNGGVYFV